MGEKKQPTCKHCFETFRDKWTLVIHERIHTGEKPYLCDRCGKTFGTSTNLNLHTRTHLLEEPYSCGFCESRFKTRKDFNKHILHTHSQEVSSTSKKSVPAREKRNFCEFCHKHFSNENDLFAHLIHSERRTSHRQQISGRENEERKEEIAGQSEVAPTEKTSEEGLEEGESVEYSVTASDWKRGEESFLCDECGMQFASEWQLDRDKKNHLDAAAMEYEGANYALPQSDEYLRELYNTRIVLPPADLPVSGITEEESQATGPVQFPEESVEEMTIKEIIFKYFDK
ncbi:zinc finger protein 595-like [Centruroides sculpturatus]|uniref:zinc finger protein 595-like n=1 Tax=Centruroides sculpturatus TaxID=218467 RepID=UPI000C6CE56A|nr:zinc finger protein 595-like [Centruroides sculpturatus]